MKTTSEIWHDYNKRLDISLKEAVIYLEPDAKIPSAQKWFSEEEIRKAIELSEGITKEDVLRMLGLKP
jgi:hypothetical protein